MTAETNKLRRQLAEADEQLQAAEARDAAYWSGSSEGQKHALWDAMAVGLRTTIAELKKDIAKESDGNA